MCVCLKGHKRLYKIIFCKHEDAACGSVSVSAFVRVLKSSLAERKTELTEQVRVTFKTR